MTVSRGLIASARLRIGIVSARSEAIEKFANAGSFSPAGMSS